MNEGLSLKLVLITALALASTVVAATTTPKPEWVWAYPWFTWIPGSAKVGQTVNWYAGAWGFGVLFLIKVQINNVLGIDINNWNYNITTQPMTLGICKVVFKGITFEDGDVWYTWATDNYGSLPPPLTRETCAIAGTGFFSVTVSGSATPLRSGTYTGRSVGGVSGIFYYSSSNLIVS